MLEIKKTAFKSGLAKVAVQCSADPPWRMVNQTLVHRINPVRAGLRNRQLLVAAKRYRAA